MHQKLQQLRDLYKRFGFKAVARHVIDRVGGASVGLQVVDVVWLDVAGLKMNLNADPKFEFRFLEAHEVAKYAEEPANELDAAMIDRAVGGRDLCFAVINEGRLAAYGWYALDAIEAEHNFGVAMSYPSTVACMYKGFTHPDFRGAKLHGVGMGLALQNLAQWGVTSLVSTADWTNDASLRSCDRLGYERLGRIVATGSKSFRLIRVPRIAQDRGVRFGRMEARRATVASRPEANSKVELAQG